MLPERVRSYLLADLAATPNLLERLLQDVDPEVYDRKPDPERFSLREMLAHLADWEPIFESRFARTRAEDNPTLEDIDPGEIALKNDYAHADPAECLRRFRAGREANLALLRSVGPEEWARTAFRTTLGSLTLEDQIAMITGHDGYHLQQTLEGTK